MHRQWWILGTSGADRNNTKMSKMSNPGCGMPMSVRADAMGTMPMRAPDDCVYVPPTYAKNYENPVSKDNILIPYGGATTVRFVPKNPGMWAMHCHIEYHLARGMFAVFAVGDEAQWAAPPEAKMPPCNAEM